MSEETLKKTANDAAKTILVAPAKPGESYAELITRPTSELADEAPFIN